MAERLRPWDGYPTAYSVYNPQIIPGFGSTYMARYLIGSQFRALSDDYLDWIEKYLPAALFGDNGKKIRFPRRLSARPVER